VGNLSCKEIIYSLAEIRTMVTALSYDRIAPDRLRQIIAKIPQGPQPVKRILPINSPAVLLRERILRTVAELEAAYRRPITMREIAGTIGYKDACGAIYHHVRVLEMRGHIVISKDSKPFCVSLPSQSQVQP
jgi:hypothetical protein